MTRLVMPLLILLFLFTAWLTSDRTISTVLMASPEGRARVIKGDNDITLVDAYKNQIQLKEPPRRIISGMLASDEILLELIDKDRLIGITAYATFPTLSNCYKKTGGLWNFMNLKVEPIVAKQPDLVIASRLADGTIITQLREAGVPVFCFGHYESIPEIRENVLILGQAVNADDRAQAIVRWMDQTVREVRQRTKDVKVRPRVLYHDGGFTAGSGTVFHEIVGLAGGRNVAAEAGITGHKMMSTEMILALKPDVIIIPQPYPESEDANFEPNPTLLDDPSFQNLPAVKNGKVFVLPSQHLNTISHHVVKAAVDVGHSLHPHLVPKQLPGITYPKFD